MHSWSTLRSFARDGSVAEQKLTPGTVRRVAGYARTVPAPDHLLPWSHDC